MINDLPPLAERVKLRAQSIQMLLCEAAWPDTTILDRHFLLLAHDVLTRLQERDETQLKEKR